MQASCGYLELAVNWITHVEALGISNWLTIAEDEVLFCLASFKLLQFYCLFDAMPLFCRLVRLSFLIVWDVYVAG